MHDLAVDSYIILHNFTIGTNLMLNTTKLLEPVVAY